MHEEFKEGLEELRDGDGSAENEDEENGFEDWVIHDERRYREEKVCAFVVWLQDRRNVDGDVLVLLWSWTAFISLYTYGDYCRSRRYRCETMLNKARNTMDKTIVLDIHVSITDV